MPFLRIAHRGAAGTRPEHTRAAFERAIELAVDMIELDVQLTRDGQLVVLHDRELGRTVPGRGPVRGHDLEALRALDAGTWFGPTYAGARVLSLAEVLDLTTGRVALNVEIKSPEPDWQATAHALVQLLAARGIVEATVISSFELGALQAVRTIAPAARLGLLWQTADLERAWARAAVLGARSIHLLWSLVNAAVVAAARRRDLAVIAWTVNDPEDIRRLAALGVDGIISDHPERFAVRMEKGLRRP